MQKICKMHKSMKKAIKLTEIPSPSYNHYQPSEILLYSVYSCIKNIYALLLTQ